MMKITIWPVKCIEKHLSKFVAAEIEREIVGQIKILTHTMDMPGIDMVECHHLMHLPLSLHWLYHLQLALRPDYLFDSLNSQCYDALSAQQPKSNEIKNILSLLSI